MNIFENFAQKYIEQGYSVIPIAPGTKACFETNWANYCVDKPDDMVLASWYRRLPRAGLGLACGEGSGTVAVDYDLVGFPEVEAAVLALLPETSYIKVGKKGWTRFYRYSEDIRSENFEFLPNMKIEILSTGRQTVLPPTIHPETKKPYYWVGDDLLDTTPEKLPSLAVSVIAELKDMLQQKRAQLDLKFDRSTSGGRHDFLLNVVWNLTENTPDQELAQYLVTLDKNMHAIPWFLDPSEPHSRKHPAEAALDFIRGAKRTIEKNKTHRQKKSDMDQGEPEFPTKANGFYFQRIEKDKVIESPDVHGLAEFTAAQKELIYVKQFDAFCRYTNGYYVQIHHIDVENYITHLTKKKIKTTTGLRNFFTPLRNAVAKDHDPDNSQTSLLNLKNGILNLSTMEIKPHSRELFFTYQLPYEYKPGVKWQNNWNWLEWLRGIFPEHPEASIEFVQAMLGYIIMGGDPFLHKSFAFVGDGSNGKSVLMKVIQKLVGKASYASVAIQDLRSEFKSILLVGKKVNLLTEIDPKILDASEFKKAVSGEELLAGQKYKPNFLFQCQARFIFNCNKLPNFGENNNAIHRRVCFLNFTREFTSLEASQFDETKFVDELDASMLLNWCIEGLQRVRATKLLPFNPFQIETSTEMQRQTDGVYAFFDECIKFEENNTKWVSIRSLYNEYVSFCLRSGFRTKNVNNFSRELRIMLHRSENFGPRCVKYGKDKEQWQFRNLRIESIS